MEEDSSFRAYIETHPTAALSESRYLGAGGGSITGGLASSREEERSLVFSDGSRQGYEAHVRKRSVEGQFVQYRITESKVASWAPDPPSIDAGETASIEEGLRRSTDVMPGEFKVFSVTATSHGIAMPDRYHYRYFFEHANTSYGAFQILQRAVYDSLQGTLVSVQSETDTVRTFVPDLDHILKEVGRARRHGPSTAKPN